MDVARKYGNASNAFFKYADTQSPDGDKILYVAVSSDKGLCGGVHSSISRTIRADVYKNNKIDLMSLGDKSKAQLSRLFPKNIVASFSSLGSKAPTFDEACLISSTILGVKPYEKITLFYNQFRSAIAYETSRTQIFTLKNVADSSKISVYEIEDDVLQNFQEFTTANKLFHAMLEGHASEVAAKMSAMDNATKNAGELIGKLTTVYNRTRQAAITTELVDIITGASAL